jgi:hypothetical protein
MLAVANISPSLGVSRVWPPSPKVAMRLERQAIERVAEEVREPYDRVEEIYGNSRSTIAHLRHHASGPTHFPDINKKVKKLLEMSDKFLAAAEKERYGTAKWRADLASAARRIEVASEEVRIDTLVIPAEIETFLKVADAARKLYEEQNYDFSGFIDQQIYVLAGMVVANFDDYQKILNE